ncbi:MAG TPA: hypothetical protein VKY85_23590 [Candidatus Angelobacter sp.]|nr:hypothetical protein [Candidatus Angelobacter sp.]
MGAIAVEPAKLAIFLIFLIAFIVITRRMFSSGKPSYSSEYPPPSFPDARDGYGTSKQPAAIGSELPFPVSLPPVQQLPNGRYNRPNVLNYYFSNLDLKAGPGNPRSFCDQLFVEFEAPETGAVWTSEYTVATPFGLQDLLDQSGQNLGFEGTIVIVPRWDMAQILGTVLDDVMEKYADPDAKAADSRDHSRRYQG